MPWRHHDLKNETHGSRFVVFLWLSYVRFHQYFPSYPTCTGNGTRLTFGGYFAPTVRKLWILEGPNGLNFTINPSMYGVHSQKLLWIYRGRRRRRHHQHPTTTTATNGNSSIRADSRLAPSQWETSLQSNDVSHWLGANLESDLDMIMAVNRQISSDRLSSAWFVCQVSRLLGSSL